MEKTIYKTLKAIVAVALVYFLLANLSVEISSVTGFTQLLSLHTGFAIAVLLTVKRLRSLLGILVGAFLFTLQSKYGFDGTLTNLDLQVILPSVAETISAYIGMKLYRHWINVDNALSHDHDLLRFLNVIPVIAIVHMVISLFVERYLDSSIAFSLIDWVQIWLGYVLGLVLVIPVTLSLLEQKITLWKNRRNILVSNFIVSLLITFFVCSNIRGFENSRLEDRFKLLTNQTATLFQGSIKEKELLQAAVAQLFVSSENVTREEFQYFVKGISEQNKFIQVIEWLPKIKLAQRAEYENEQRKYYGDDFSITEVKSKGVLIPATKRDVYYPITFLEPESGNDIAKGFDPSVAMGAKDLIKEIVISGKAQARSPVQVIRKTGFTDAFIVYKPIYQKFDGTKTLDPSESEVMGFVNIAVKVDDFIASIVGPKETANFNLQWQDVETGKYYYETAIDASFPFQHVIDIHLSGRNMKLIFSPTDAFIKDAATEVSAIAMITIFVLTSLFSLLVLNITARTSGIQTEVKERTKELEDANEKLELLSNKDVLTHLYNRRYFEKALKDEFERSRRYNTSFALVTFDIDFFKKVNDQYGHPCGDLVIKAVADYLINTSRATDVVARLGGEEFGLILLGQTSTQVMAVVERIRIDMSNIKVKYEQSTVQFTCSFGIALFDEHVENISELVKRADKAMYEAKKLGRNRTQLFSKS